MQIVVILGLAAVTVLLLNLRALIRGINEVVGAEYRSRAVAPQPAVPPSAEGALTTAS